MTITRLGFWWFEGDEGDEGVCTIYRWMKPVLCIITDSMSD